jgi:hypothetical protein
MYDAKVAAARKCVVKLRDTEGVEHAAQVVAESLYEAACLALRQFRRSAWSRETAVNAETLQVEVWEAPTVYKINVVSLENWLARGGGSPREVLLRQKIRSLMKERGGASGGQ